MEIVLWVVAVLALLSAVSTRRRLGAMQDTLDGIKRDQTVKGGDVDELRQGLDGLRRLTALMAAGKPVDADMVRENRLFRELPTAELQKKFEGDAGTYVIDVRSDQEWGGGHVPGALHIPLDALKTRLNEVARDAREIHVICAGGQRSAAAADYLANRGYLNVFNVAGGMNSWRGETSRD